MKKVIALIVAAAALTACSTAPSERTCRKTNVAGSAILTCATPAEPLTESDRLVLQKTPHTVTPRRAAN